MYKIKKNRLKYKTHKINNKKTVKSCTGALVHPLTNRGKGNEEKNKVE